MKKFIYTDDDLLRFLLKQIKTIQIDAKESDKDKIVSATIIYKNGGKTDYRLPRQFIDYLMDRLNGLFHKRTRDITDDKDSFLWFEEENNDLPDKCSDVDDNGDVNDDKCPDPDACADSMCCDCAERTYSFKEYYDLMEESLKKDHEIWQLKRTVEALEYLIYNCIPKDDRRAS